MWSMLIAPIAGLFTKALDLVDKFIPDKDLAQKLKAALTTEINQIVHTEVLALLESQTKIIVAEATGESWLQRNWRPLLMTVFGTIVANNYILAPYLGALFGLKWGIELTIPPDMWSLLKLGVSGYVVGRSLEKIADGTGVKGAINKLKNGSSESDGSSKSDGSEGY